MYRSSIWHIGNSLDCTHFASDISPTCGRCRTAAVAVVFALHARGRGDCGVEPLSHSHYARLYGILGGDGLQEFHRTLFGPVG